VAGAGAGGAGILDAGGLRDVEGLLGGGLAGLDLLRRARVPVSARQQEM